MAKFCTKCGSEMVDGKCPKCKEVKEEVVVATTGTVDVKQSFMDCLEVLKGIFTKPFEVIKKFVVDNKFVTGIILVVMAAISSGIYKMAELKNPGAMTSSGKIDINDFTSLLGSGLSGNEPEYLKEFMTTFVTSLAEYALIAVIGYLVVSKLFKGSASIKEMISAVGVSLVLVIVANLLNSILSFVDAEVVQRYIIGYITSFASIIKTLVLAGGVYQAAKIDKNKLFVSVASIMIFSTVVIDICNKLFN